MSPRIPHLLLAVVVLVAACSGEAEPTTTTNPTTSTSTSTSSTTTTLPPTTTTTTVPFSVEGATDELAAVVEAFYRYAAGETTDAPPAPEVVIEGISPVGDLDTPRQGTASMGAFKEQGVAVVEMGSDLFLSVDDGQGWRIVGGEWPSLSIPAYYGPTTRHVAVVGSDARPGETVEATRADSIHFVGLGASGNAAVVGLPRDSYVPVPGFGRGKITNSLALGGPDAMMAAFRDLTGLPLEGYVLTGFRGFQNLINEVLGAVSVKVPYSISDRWAKAYLDAGRQDLDGAEALGFARARKTVPGGDFTRSEHQGLIMISAVAVVQQLGMSAIPQLMEKAEPHLVTDLSVEQLLTFAARTMSVDIGAIDNVVAPGSPGWAGSASVVYLSSSVDQLWADLENGYLSD